MVVWGRRERFAVLLGAFVDVAVVVVVVVASCGAMKPGSFAFRAPGSFAKFDLAIINFRMDALKAKK